MTFSSWVVSIAGRHWTFKVVLGFLCLLLVQQIRVSNLQFAANPYFNFLQLPYYKGQELNPLNVAVIGGAGYIGSMLTLHLKSFGYNVIAFDEQPNLMPSFPVVSMHSSVISKSKLQSFGTVIFLGGCTGRRSCGLLSVEERFKKNIQDVVDVADQLAPTQHFIVASTSAISEGRQNAIETDAVFEQLLDEYSRSMYQREEALKRRSSQSSNQRITMLRFGTVVGVSLGQRTDLLIPSLFKSAYTGGVLKVHGYSTMRSFLWLQDLNRAVHAIIEESNKNVTETFSKGFNILNLASFSATILKVASTVSSITGARLDVEGTQDLINSTSTPLADFQGFSLDSSLFEVRYNFTFQGDLATVLVDIDSAIPSSITAKGIHSASISHQEHKLDTIPCPVCGSTDQQLALDLGDQPFANDFQIDKEKALLSPRFPLKLVRCRHCNHFHLSHIASRDDLFANYLYQSGTSKTLSTYFAWLANKVIQETNQSENGTVLEIACNDGSQLDQFKKRGWRTFGVDPAANIVPLAQAKGHTVKVGFWGSAELNFPELHTGENLNAIVAQNVLAHVPDPVAFLKSCAAIMGPKTLLFVQTSQCNMHQLGQFDTAYHEHISFFTGHSFLKAATLAGLYITSFETTPIHGTSCLVTMELLVGRNVKCNNKDCISDSLNERLQQEVIEGITTDFFYEKYAERSYLIRSWLNDQTRSYVEKGYAIGAYGAAAKGMTLLHFLFNEHGEESKKWIEFVLDDAPLKQNTFCPGTLIPVLATDRGADQSPGKPLVLIILAWNFWDEIAENLKLLLQGQRREVLAILPFPVSKVVSLKLDDDGNQTLVNTIFEMPYYPTPIPNPLRLARRKPVLMITHISNEEMMLPFFIIHHAPMCDRMIVIDFDSTDNSVSIVEKYAPPSWQVVNSTTGSEFFAEITDQQVMYWEKQYADHWAIALTVTEFLIHANFRESLMRLHPFKEDEQVIYQLPLFSMVGNDTVPLHHFTSLPEQRHQYAVSALGHRWMHLGTSETHQYSVGRHGYSGAGVDINNLSSGFIMKWQWTPWPETADRKLDIGKHIPQSDRDKGWGFHHHEFYTTREEIEQYRKDQITNVDDFCDDNGNPEFVWAHRIFHASFGKVCYP